MTDGVTYNEAPHRVFRRASGRPVRTYRPKPMGPALPPSMWSPRYVQRCPRCGGTVIAGYWAGRYLTEDCPGCGLKGLR